MSVQEAKVAAEGAVAPEHADRTARPVPDRTKSARVRPDPRPARLMIGAGAAAAVALIANGLVAVPLSSGAAVTTADPASTRDRQRPTRVKQRVRYVRLKPGQKAPRGAKVIREEAPAPRVVVRLVAPSRSVAPAPVQRRTVTRTRQSGG
jgi:hypothetical protein